MKDGKETFYNHISHPSGMKCLLKPEEHKVIRCIVILTVYVKCGIVTLFILVSNQCISTALATDRKYNFEALRWLKNMNIHIHTIWPLRKCRQ